MDELDKRLKGSTLEIKTTPYGYQGVLYGGELGESQREAIEALIDIAEDAVGRLDEIDEEVESLARGVPGLRIVEDKEGWRWEYEDSLYGEVSSAPIPHKVLALIDFLLTRR